jgi:GMP synthase (glutamine-hydrolysing)
MFNPGKFVEEQVALIRAKITGKAITAVSGGVDSTVAAVIAQKAIGDRLIAVFVDTGYLRKGEPEYVKKLLDTIGLNYRYIDAREEFMTALKGVIDPEQKRKIIGERFIRIFERVARKEQAEWLVQGTIAPDWIESGGALRDTIKSHHNVGGLPAVMDIKLVEPLRDLYKDETRKLATYLNLPVAERQPFPGPGLAIRILGEATPEATALVREACAITETEIETAVRAGIMQKPWQYFAVLLPSKSVGVHGDLRAYGYTVVVRAVESIDAMTAEYSKIPHEVLERISTRITNTLKDKVVRVVYDITNKPPSTVEWE